MIADSHCHLDFPELYDELESVIDRAAKKNVKFLLTICTTIESFKKIKLIVDKYKNIYGTFGIHPHETNKYKDRVPINNYLHRIEVVVESDNNLLDRSDGIQSGGNQDNIANNAVNTFIQFLKLKWNLKTKFVKCTKSLSK